MTLSEADICEKFITPAIQRAGWNTIEQIYREYTLRPGRVVVRGNHAARDKRSVLRADYVLFYKTNIPLVVVEAKDNCERLRECGLALLFQRLSSAKSYLQYE